MKLTLQDDLWSLPPFESTRARPLSGDESPQGSSYWVFEPEQNLADELATAPCDAALNAAPPAEETILEMRSRLYHSWSKPKTNVFLWGQCMGMFLAIGLWAAEPSLLPRLLSHLYTAPQNQAIVPAPGTLETKPLSASDSWRTNEIAKIAAANPTMAPWIAMAKNGSWRECGDLVSGRQPQAYPAPGDYSLFLKWLLLDLPSDKDTKRAVPRLYVRRSSSTELLDLCDHLSHPGSSLLNEVITMAEIAQEMHGFTSNPTDVAHLHRLAARR